MKNIHINDSYNTGDPAKMKEAIDSETNKMGIDSDPKKSMNRSYGSMYVEWALHNVGYHVTKPFTKNKKIKHINERCKHVDLEEHTKKK